MLPGARFSLDPEDNNQLWIGRGGNLTPCHYDTWITTGCADGKLGSVFQAAIYLSIYLSI